MGLGRPLTYRTYQPSTSLSYNSTGHSTGGSTGKNSESLGKTEVLPGSRLQRGRWGGYGPSTFQLGPALCRPPLPPATFRFRSSGCPDKINAPPPCHHFVLHL